MGREIAVATLEWGMRLTGSVSHRDLWGPLSPSWRLGCSMMCIEGREGGRRAWKGPVRNLGGLDCIQEPGEC